MHLSAMNNCKLFFQTYAEFFPNDRSTKVVEIGSQDVNGSLRSIAPDAFDYIGVDFQAAKGVDVVLTDPYSLPFASESVDIVLSSSCFEHSEMFWLVFLDSPGIVSGSRYPKSSLQSQGHQNLIPCPRSAI